MMEVDFSFLAMPYLLFTKYDNHLRTIGENGQNRATRIKGDNSLNKTIIPQLRN